MADRYERFAAPDHDPRKDLGLGPTADSRQTAAPPRDRSQRLAELDPQQRRQATWLQHFGAHTYRRVDKEGVFHTEWDKK